MKFSKVLYINNIDISKPNGPGTNELTFIRSLMRLCQSQNISVSVMSPEFDGDTAVDLEGIHQYRSAVTSNGSLGQYALALRNKVLGNSAIRKFHSLERTLGSFDLVLLRLDKSYLLPLASHLVQNKRAFAVRHFHLRFLGKDKPKAPQFARLLREAVYISSTWNSVREYLQNQGVAKVHLMENGIELTEFPEVTDKEKYKFELGFGRNDFVVGYIGGKPFERGAELLIENARALKSENPDFRFLIIGGDKGAKTTTEEEFLKRTEQDKEVRDWFYVQGPVPFSKVAKYFAALDVGLALVPEKEALSYGNSSQKIYQYIATGAIPIVPVSTNEKLVRDHKAVAYDYKRPLKDFVAEARRIKKLSYPEENRVYLRENFDIDKKVALLFKELEAV